MNPTYMNPSPTFSKTYDADVIKVLDLYTFAGSVELIGHDENTIKIEVFAAVRSFFTLYFLKDPLRAFDHDTHQLSFLEDGEVLKIYAKPKYWHLFNWFNFQSTSFKIYLPRSVNSYTKTNGGNIRLYNLGGNHTINTWGGNVLALGTFGQVKGKTLGGKIEIMDCKGKIELGTMGGNISLMGNQADVRIDTKGGHLHVQNHLGTVHGSSWGGNIYAHNVDGSFECHTAGGNIHLHQLRGNIGVSTKGGSIKGDVLSIHQYAWFDTAGGNIKLALPLSQGMNVEASGSRVKFPLLENFHGYQTQQEIRGAIQGGGPNVSIKTLAGKVQVFEANPMASSPASTFQTPQASSATADITSDDFDKQKPVFKSSIDDDIDPTEAEEKSRPRLLPPYHLLFNITFCLVVGYAINSVLFFSLESYFAQLLDFSLIRHALVQLSLTSSMASVVAIYFFLTFIEPKIPIDSVKFFPLMGCTLLISDLLHSLIQWGYVAQHLWSINTMMAVYFYFILPVIISWLYLFYWLRTSGINRKISEQEYQLLHLEKLKSKAQLDALEARINPHFLYNSLNSIAGLIHEQADKAEEMTIQLAKLFRYTTGRTEGNFHTINDELEVIRAYLMIEEVRFGHRLSYLIDCEEPLLSANIPRFLLQPLVENAIKHGISKMATAGVIELNIAQVHEQIIITIHDNGPAFDEHLGGGFGLRSIKEKLQLVYQRKASLALLNEPQKMVKITLPLT